MAYVYRHIRHDLNEPFYIGVGTDKNYFRAFQKSKSKRSGFWHNVINKTSYSVEILIDDIPESIAFSKEMEFIKLYGRKDLGTGTLVNLTDGGEKPPVSMGDANPAKRKDVREKLSASRIGIKFSEEHKRKLSESKIRNKVIPPSRKGMKMSKEGVAKMLKGRLTKRRQAESDLYFS